MIQTKKELWRDSRTQGSHCSHLQFAMLMYERRPQPVCLSPFGVVLYEKIPEHLLVAPIPIVEQTRDVGRLRSNARSVGVRSAKKKGR